MRTLWPPRTPVIQLSCLFLFQGITLFAQPSSPDVVFTVAGSYRVDTPNCSPTPCVVPINVVAGAGTQWDLPRQTDGVIGNVRSSVSASGTTLTVTHDIDQDFTAGGLFYRTWTLNTTVAVYAKKGSGSANNQT